ncbi:30S ribosomal protein S20 [Candidatus Dojkabacteria bacterium]|nr:30S ribosomal protein S20 [Candidatus Dojkabacteria bacterium]
MANTKSAKKAIRSSAKKHKVNSILKRNYKTARKELLESISVKNKKEVSKKAILAMKAIDKAGKKKTIHKKTASRYKSRIAKAVNKM